MIPGMAGDITPSLTTTGFLFPGIIFVITIPIITTYPDTGFGRCFATASIPGIAASGVARGAAVVLVGMRWPSAANKWYRCTG